MSISPVRLCIVGPGGRMGRAVAELAQSADEVALRGALVRPESALLGGEVAPGVAATADLAAALDQVDAYIDFSVPEASAAVALAAAERGIAGVIGTTGLQPAHRAAIDTLATRAPVVLAPNFSLGVHLLLALAETAARALGPSFDLEVVELHHRRKRDAPSGTAIALAEALKAGHAAADPDAHALTTQTGRDGQVGPRADHELGVMAVRGGDVIGEHTAYFLGQHERIELTHRAGSRNVFAAGAIAAARWAAGRAPGHYAMRDVLGL